MVPRSRRGESVHHVQASSRPENLTRTPFTKRTYAKPRPTDEEVSAWVKAMGVWGGPSCVSPKKKKLCLLVVMVNPLFGNTPGVSVRDDQVFSRSENLTRTPCMTCRYAKPRSVGEELSGSVVRVGWMAPVSNSKGVQRKVKADSTDSEGRCDRGLYLSETNMIVR